VANDGLPPSTARTRTVYEEVVSAFRAWVVVTAPAALTANGTAVSGAQVVVEGAAVVVALVKHSASVTWGMLVLLQVAAVTEYELLYVGTTAVEHAWVNWYGAYWPADSGYPPLVEKQAFAEGTGSLGW